MERAERIARYQAQSRIADELASRGETESALRLLKSLEDEAGTAKDSDYQAFFAAEQLFYGVANYAGALQRLQSGIQSATQSGHVGDQFLIRNIGVYHSSLGEFDAAIACFDQALALNPKDYHAHREKGISLAKKGNEDAAIACFDQALALNPKDYDALQQKGLSLAKKGDEDAAITCYDQALTLNPKDYHTHRNKGVTLANKGDLDAAIACFDQALALNPLDSAAHRNKGATLTNKGDLDAAIACFDQALTLNPKDYAALRYKGISLSKKGDLVAGIACFDQALILNPKDYDAHRDKGVSLSLKGDFDAAIACYDKAIALNPKDYDAHRDKGATLANNGDIDTAIACFDQALLLNPKDYDAHRDKGVSLSKKGDEDAAIACYDQALTLNPDDGLTMFRKGITLTNKNDIPAALQWFKKALASPKFNWDAQAYMWMGDACKQGKQEKDAIEHWKTAEALFRTKGDKDNAELALRKIAAAGKSPKQRGPSDRAALSEAVPVPDSGDKNSPERRIWAKIEKFGKTKYEDYGKRYDASKSADEVLAILRGWGSAVGLLPMKGGVPCRGGGYLLKWRGKGLLIDPGFDCLTNLHEADFHCQEIHAVVVSHNHPDHNNDLRSFDDIRYEMYKRANDDHAREIWTYKLLWDKDTASQRKFDPEEALHRQEIKMESSPQNMAPKQFCSDSLPYRIHWFKANHATDVQGAVGLRVDCLNADGTTALTVGFTCDTEYYDKLLDDKHLGKCDILIAHISMPDEEEYTDPKHVKKGHLGYRGVEKLIKGAQPKLTLVGEFWAGITDLRIDLVSGLRSLCKPAAIFPASIGLELKPSTMEIRCTNCKQWTEHSKIHVGSPAIEFGRLSYLCPHCRLSPV
jgi:tetratricopeptide (TPR) repeat protein